MALSGFAAGANDALQELLARRYAEAQQAQRMQLEQQQLAQQNDQFTRRLGMDRDELGVRQMQMLADNADRTQQRERQTRLDTEAAGDRARDRSQQQNATGMRRMIGDFLMQRGQTPIGAGERQTLQGMAITEGIDLPQTLTVDPEQEFKDYARKKQIDLQYRPPTQGSQPTERVLVSPDGQSQRVARGSGEVNTLLGQGWKLYDAVAARSAQPENQEEAKDTAREVQRIAGALGSHAGFGGTFGKWSSMNPQLTSSQATVDARSLLNSLKGLLTLENMGKMKGVLSDTDMRILQQASTTLAAEISEDAARGELNRLGRVMSKLTGEAWSDVGGVPVRQTPAGGRAGGPGPTDGQDALLDELLRGGQ